MKLKPYPAYKDSGVEWLGQVPEGWITSKLKFVASVVMGQSPSSEDCNQSEIGFPFLQGCAEFGLKHPIPKQYCEVATKFSNIGDFLFSVRAPVGSMNLSDRKYGIGRGLCAISGNTAHQDFLYWSLDYNKAQLYALATGSTFEAVTIGEVGSLDVANPPFDEQRQISNFLNHETSKLDQLIAKQKKMIELLQEKRQAIISRAISKGLNLNVPMNDSGVAWLGEVPKHWQIQSLRRAISEKLINGIFKKKDQFGSGVLLVNVYDIFQSDFKLKFESLDRVECTSEEVLAYQVLPGDLFFVRSSLKQEGIAVAAVAEEYEENVVFECHLIRARPNREKLNPRFGSYLLNSSIYRAMMISIAKVTTMTTIDQEAILSTVIALPTTKEQAEISSYLDYETTKIDTLIEKTQKSIELAKEHRTALISAAVTGKIDVREAA